jgi:hypothetical protein
MTSISAATCFFLTAPISGGQGAWEPCDNVGMNDISRHPLRRFTVIVTHDAESGMWIGECDELCAATEAPTFEALTARMWLIAPEMALENGLNLCPQDMLLLFQHEQTVTPELLAA